jgi:hypothetical protein
MWLLRRLFAKPSSLGFLVGDGGYGFRVVGTLRHQETLEQLSGGRRHEGVHCRCQALLTPEPNNPYDRYAVAVTIRGSHVGYIDRPDAPELLIALVKSGCLEVLCDAQIVGGWDRGDDHGFFGVRLNVILPFRIKRDS